jgi:hypothetical protein
LADRGLHGVVLMDLFVGQLDRCLAGTAEEFALDLMVRIGFEPGNLKQVGDIPLIDQDGFHRWFSGLLVGGFVRPSHFSQILATEQSDLGKIFVVCRKYFLA